MPVLWKPRLFYSSLYKNPTPPIVVGATGGSGTRVFQAILQQAGIYMGHHLNHAGDAMDLEPFLDRWINPLLETIGKTGFDITDVPPVMRRESLRDLGQSLKIYCAHRPPQVRWGWKNPRSMYVAPLIHAFFPDMRFIHVVRDGRDMAFSDNQNQRNKHYAALFGRMPVTDTPLAGAAASAQLWAAANGQIVQWGQSVLGNNYYRIRLEDLCTSPETGIRDLFSWLDYATDVAPLAQLVTPPESLGRWRNHDSATLDTITDAARSTLVTLGYQN